MIAAAITKDVAIPELLLQPGTSPHDYSMKPSDIRKIASADFIFWVGEDLERFLEKPLDRFSQTFSVLAVMDAPEVKVQKFLMAADEGEGSHEGKGEEAHTGHDDHDHGDHDPHIWLEPHNVIAIAKAMEKALVAGDKVHEAIYKANFKHFEEQVNAADQRNRQLLKPISDKGFFVFHDAWGYFTKHYDLKVAGVFTLSPEQQPGARHIAEIRQKIKAEGNTCIFREPQFQPAYLDSVIHDLNVQVTELDPLASQVSVDPQSYPDFLERTAKTINSCLTSTL